MYPFFLFLIASITTFASNKEFIIIEKNEVVETDFYATGSVIEISGVCKKDVYIAATQILIDGVIEGDLICIAGSLQITGEVKGALRGLAGQSLIAGTVGKNTTMASAAFTSTPTSQFLSNVFLGASTADISGTLSEDLFLGASNIRYSAQNTHNLHLYAGTVRLGSNARVGGYVEYSSPKPIDIQKGAVIGKELIEKKGVAKFYSKSVIFNNLLIGSKMAAALMNLLFTFISGLIFIKLWPNILVRSLNNLKHHFVKSLGQGAIFLIAVPLVGVMLLVTILGIPIAITLIAFSVLGLYTAKIHVLYFLADRWKHKFMKKWGIISVYSLLCGIYFIFQLIPYLGIGISWISTLVGIGAVVHFPKRAKIT